MSYFFSLSRNDFAKGLIVAVLAAVFTWAAQVFNAPGFDWATIRWDEVLRVASGALIAYLSKNLFSTSDGKFMGRV